MIKQLSRQVADMIAAGEVVERPASVVKELVENAVDAGATSVTVEFEHGGTRYLRVTDNGTGIPAKEVETAFLRHATSKIEKAEDLDGIQTMGFRGEALAAISSVSRMQVLTLAEGEIIGTSLELEGGTVIDRSEAGCPQGTTMIVRDLFYNTPARMKFLKRDSAEASQILGVMQRAALSYPEISFRLIRDGQTEMSTPGNGDLKTTIYHVFGKDFADGLIPVQSEYEGIRIHGFVTRPDINRGNRSMQHFFVNRRAIYSKILTAALEAAFKNEMPPTRFASCVLMIEISPYRLDVNIHPAKAEIKFQQERTAFDALYYAVKDAIASSRELPKMQLPAEKKNPAENIFVASSGKQKDFWNHMSASEYQKTVKSDGRHSFSSGRKETTFRPSETKGEYQFFKGLSAENEPKDRKFEEKKYVQPAEAEKPRNLEKPEESVASAGTNADFRFIGETMHTYILIEQDEKLLLIDKHAAHERILYERLKAYADQIPTQILLFPQNIQLNGEDSDLLLEEQDFMRELGFEIEDFGGSILVRGVPSDLTEADLGAVLGELAEQLRTGNRIPRIQMRDHMLYTMSCKAAIKGGWDTGIEELKDLARQVLTRPEIRHCPHGRPVMIELTKGQLAHQFERS